MEKINTEIVISSLFNVGFNKVDVLLFTFVVAKIAMDSKQRFLYEEQEISSAFYKYVDYSNNGLMFQLKDGLSIDTNVSEEKGYYRSLGSTLTTNHYLIEYLRNLDFSEIVLKKAELYNIQSIEEADRNMFSDKEIEILKQVHFHSTNHKSLKK